jgi:hypothetical protein
VLRITAMAAASYPFTSTFVRIPSAAGAASSAHTVHPLLERAVGRFLEWVVSSVEDRRERRMRSRR